MADNFKGGSAGRSQGATGRKDREARRPGTSPTTVNPPPPKSSPERSSAPPAAKSTPERSPAPPEPRTAPSDKSPSADPLEGFTPERLRELHRAIVLPRLIEEKMLNLLRQGRLSKWFSGIGQEAIAVGVASALDADDWILTMHRNLGVFTTRGFELERLFRQLFGKDGGHTKGRDRTFHFGFLEKHVVGMISHLGATLPVADGLVLAAQMRGETRIAAAFTGEGGTSEGDFHEALNLAAVWKLPVLFVVENNGYGLSTPTSEQYACEHLADRGAGYGMPGVVVDGNDLLAVLRAVGEAAERARAGRGPTLLEFMTFRMRGHEEASGTAYVPKALFEEWGKKDPVARFESLLVARGVLTQADADAVRAEIKDRIHAIADEALAAPDPSSSAEAELADVYAPSLLTLSEPEGAAERLGAAETSRSASDTTSWPQKRYVDAVMDGLRTAMRRNPRALLLGQDIAEYGGVFKVTEGFLEEFGRDRVRNTPIIESGAVGAALGLALDGFVPMIEMQFGDFVTCGFNQVVNHLAKTHYRWGARVPVVVRCPIGGGVGAGPFHSQNPEAWFTHVAGLKVVAPATPYDAKGLLVAAFEDGNPVLYLEHKYLYRSAKGPVPSEDYAVPIGRARIARAGEDATIVTWGVGLSWALEAAESFAKDGRGSVEVIDLRSLLPWDRGAVMDSMKKTGRALVLHEAPVTGGFGGEVAAAIAQDAFGWLDAPVARVGGLDTPIPFSRALEEIFSPKGRLAAVLAELLAY